ncbi:MAG: peptidoglycan-associated lipoprotein Pal [Pseudomonadota bacterium]|jgi:peptidoglycan-associated lipoprotein|nr:peptidoglycan-associated lipoprotein Pal [Pseudomonadota bacterium]MEC8673731.1 peptidoglycan-associated lipoprotein Pal [Pseudomonadota bacterium]
MLQRLIALAAVAFFVAACETASQTSTDSAGESSSSTASTSASTTSTSSSGSSGSSSSSSSSSSASSAAAAATSAEDALAKIGNTVYFGYDSSALSDDAQATLMRQAGFLRGNPSLTVTIEGHCDERGTREYNLALGERRATAARDYLLAQGVDPARIRVISYGKERPVASGSTEQSWSKNRRAATVLN